MEDKVNNSGEWFSQLRFENTIYYTGTYGYNDLEEYLTQLFEYFNRDIFPKWNYKNIKII